MHDDFQTENFGNDCKNFLTSLLFLCFYAHVYKCISPFPCPSEFSFSNFILYQSMSHHVGHLCDEGNLFLTNLLHLILLTSNSSPMRLFQQNCSFSIYPSAFLNLPTQTKKSQFRCLPFKPTLSEAVAIMSSHFPYVYIVISSHHKKRG